MGTRQMDAEERRKEMKKLLLEGKKIYVNQDGTAQTRKENDNKALLDAPEGILA